MQDPTGRERAASYYPGTPEPISAPAGPQPARWERWEHIPAELRERKQWLACRSDKVPHTVKPWGVVTASVTKPDDWMPFSGASLLAGRDGHIGYVLSAADPFTCIDLDVKDDTPSEQIELYNRILAGFDSYTERSMRGLGFHIWVRGKVGKGLRRDGVEVYSQERFIVCTGDALRRSPIRDRQSMLDTMTMQMRALGTPPAALVELPPIESDGDHWHRKASAINGAKFQELWFGRWEALGIGDGSQSCADLALVRMLCFNNPSNEQVRRLFRLSALGQRKKAARVDYVDGMIAEARAADAERARVHAQAAAAMAPGIEAELEAYRNRQRWSA
jgi:primase-polymerase (primpol)-like protein